MALEDWKKLLEEANGELGKGDQKSVVKEDSKGW